MHGFRIFIKSRNEQHTSVCSSDLEKRKYIIYTSPASTILKRFSYKLAIERVQQKDFILVTYYDV